MKKTAFITAFIFGFLILFLTSSFNAYAQATVSLSGIWSRDGNSYTGQQTGNNISIIGKNGAGFQGTITGNTAQGKEHLVSEKCPSLSHDSPATGVISSDGNSITVTFTNNIYDFEKCTDNPNSDFKDTHIYTRTSPQNSPTVTILPSSSPTETPLNLNGIWTTVNEKGTSFTFSGHHAGNSLTLQITDASDPEIKGSIGKTSLSGTLSGHAFSGTQILIAYAPKCLGKYFNTDGVGTVAADGSSITVSYTNFKYNGNTCAKLPGTEFTGSIMYVRVGGGQNPTRGKDAKQISPSPEITEKPKEPSLGVSSRDFRALAQANAEFQQAQADLEEIKKNKDPRWEDNRNFANDYNSRPQTESNTVPSTLDVIQERLGQTADGSSVYLDIKDIYDQYVKGEAASYTGVSLVTDVANGVIKFTDLTNNGVSVVDATSKTMIDTIGTGSLYLLPPVKLADMAATMPDRILNTLGLSEKGTPRKVTGFLKDNSPSAFIELSTDAMIATGNWTNLGGAVSTAWDDLKSAQGFGEKAQATLDLVGTAVGAVPVAIAMQVRDEVSTLFTAMKFGASGAGNIVSNWFTYPN